MKPNEAAAKIRDQVRPEEANPAFCRNVAYVEKVTRELGLEPTLLNALLVGRALDRAKIAGEQDEFPKMLFTRDEPEEGIEATRDERHKCWHTIVADADAEKALKGNWVESIEKLPEIKPQ